MRAWGYRNFQNSKRTMLFNVIMVCGSSCTLMRRLPLSIVRAGIKFLFRFMVAQWLKGNNWTGPGCAALADQLVTSRRS